MLNFFLVLLHHPLTGILFAIWHFLSWSEHGAQIFDGFSQTMLTKMGFEAADFKDLNKAWYGKSATAALAPHPLTTTEVAPLLAVADTPDVFTTMAPKPSLQYPLSSYTDPIAPMPPPQYRFYQETTMVPTSSWCPGSQDHVGEWRAGPSSLHLHYICEKYATRGHCSPGWHSFQDSCYRAITDEDLRFVDAQKSCALQMSYLVKIESKAENEFVQKLVGWKTAWIGLQWIGRPILGAFSGTNHWVWTEGMIPLAVSNWNMGYNLDRVFSSSMHVYMNDWNALCMPPPSQYWPDNIPMDFSILEPVIIALVMVLTVVVTFAPCFFACVYKKKVSDRRQAVPSLDAAATQAPTAQNFPFRFCGCFEDMDVCWHAFCCSMARSADTHHAAGTEKFWNIVLFWIGSILLGSIVGDPTGTLPGIIMAVGMTYKRRALKARLGVKAGSSFEDFMLWWCCGFCAVAQEARAIDQAAGVTVKCCCSMRRRSSPANLVGPPVVTAAGSLVQPLQASPQMGVASFPAASQQQQQQPIYMVPHNVVTPELSPSSAPPRTPSDISAISLQEVHATQPMQPIVAQVISIQPPAARYQ